MQGSEKGAVLDFHDDRGKDLDLQMVEESQKQIVRLWPFGGCPRPAHGNRLGLERTDPYRKSPFLLLILHYQNIRFGRSVKKDLPDKHLDHWW